MNKNSFTKIKTYIVTVLIISGILFWLALILDLTMRFDRLFLITFVFWFYTLPIETGFLLYFTLIFVLAYLIERRKKNESKQCV